MIRNVVFDMGGVLLDYQPIKACRHFAPDEASARAICAALFDAPEWKCLDHGTMTEDEALAVAQSRLPQGLHAAAALVMAHWDDYAFEPTPGMAELIAKLKRGGRRVYLLSNAGLRLRSYQWRLPSVSLFDGLLVSAEERMVKPDAAIYRRLCERFGLAPEECFFIDDLIANVEGARNVGFSATVFDGDVAKLRATLREAGALPE